MPNPLPRPWHGVPYFEHTALQDLVDTIDSTGGVRIDPDGGAYLPEGDPSWGDLGRAYVKACCELGIEPLVQGEGEEP